MSADRPINADVESAPDADDAAARSPEPPKARPPEPKAEVEPEMSEALKSGGSPKSEPVSADSPSTPPLPHRRRKGIPGAIKLVAVLVALAIGFIALAIVAGGGGSNDKSATKTVTTTGAAPVVAAPSEPSGSGGSEESDEGAAEAPTASAEELGYPGFATDNTTRVGGSDAATIAAASALAVFPSTTPAQRPAAVTVVSEQGKTAADIAAAASVLMAPPVRAPLLFTTKQGLPAPTIAALEALNPQGSPVTGGAAAFGGGSDGQALLGGGKTVPLVGTQPEPQATIAAIAEEREKLVGGPPDAYLLTSYDPEFAAPAAAWAARSGDPVLVTGSKELESNYRGILLEHKKVPVFVLGPPSSVSDQVLREIAKIGNPVKRVAGKDPVANALAFARYGAGKFGWDVNDPGHGFVLARAQDPLAAVAASALSASGTWGPLLLTDSADTLPDEVREYFLDVKPGYTTDPTRAFYNHVWVIGDQEAIDVKQQAEVNELAELAKIGEGSEG